MEWLEHPAARDEFTAAHTRYAAVYDGVLGEQFIDELERAMDLLLVWPEAGTPYGGIRDVHQVRTWHLGKFPYNVIYFVRGGSLIVIAYAHERRRPGYWQDRLEE